VDVTLQYIDSSGLVRSSLFTLKALKGLTEPDECERISVMHDGVEKAAGRKEQVLGFRKIISITIQAGTSPLQRRFLADFITSERKSLRYQNYFPQLGTDEDLKSEWLNACEYGRQFTITLPDIAVYKKWDDGLSVDELMYLKRDVQIEGTVAEPELFITNVGKLTAMENGNPYPSFNADTHDFFIGSEDGNEASFKVLKGSIEVVAGNLQFYGFHTDFGQAADDGLFYSSIAIFLQAKT
jgi:hypothetical protein